MSRNDDSSGNGVGVLIGILILIALAIGGWFETTFTVSSGTYAIKQAAVTGDIVAYMTPGVHSKMFGTITEFPVSETFFFTHDREGQGQGSSGSSSDDSIEVRFNDGSICNISGTCRVDMPRDEQEAIGLVTKFGYRTHEQVEQKLIKPTLRRALNLTANLMSSKESYSEKKLDFYKWAWDQIENGVYQTKDELTTETDPITGADVKKVRKVILTDPKTGKYLREQNPLEGTGIKLSIFDIKSFVYESKVLAQISTQQDAISSINTARANAQKAAQDAITAKALGEAKIATAQYEELEKKTHATVQADQKAAVAVIEAQQLVDIAKLTKETALTASAQEKEVALVKSNQQKEVAGVALDTAKLEAQAVIEVAEGKAKANKLLLESDGALDKKLAAWTDYQKYWAQAYAAHAVPGVMIMKGDGGSATASNQSEAMNFMELLSAKAASDLSLDLKVRAPTAASLPVASPVKR